MSKKILWIARILVGALFIFSGLIKANDPFGFAYKLDEYFQIFHMPFFEPYTVGMSIVICILEVMMGVWLLIGFMPVLNAWALLGMIIFFDFLTGYTALANLAKENPSWVFSKGMAWVMGVKDNNPEMINALSDCGCFGDFLKLKPWQSFLKDVVLTILIIIIFRRKNEIEPVFNKALLAIASFMAAFVCISFPLICYYNLPAKDFLPYKIGNDIVEQSTIPAGAPTDSIEYRFIYRNKKTSEEKIFGITNLPDSTWEFVDTKHKVIREGYHPPIHDFKIYDKDGNEFTDIITEEEGFKMVVIANQIQKANTDNMRRISSLIEKIKSKHPEIHIFLLTSTNLQEAEKYKSVYHLDIDFFGMDGTVLKTMMRSNPGVYLFKKSKVLKKWSGYTVPVDMAKVFKYMK
ncbi:MAG: DoxX family protein [Bacteroidetes bacterium]|nr:DoxX family protein [Bacteroidota bacterium]